MQQLMGDGEDPETFCTISPDCLQAMFTKGMSEYYITHQLIYTIVAEMVSCCQCLSNFFYGVDYYNPD